MPGCCSAAAHRRIPRTCSSTRWCKTPPMQLCCVPAASSCTPPLLRHWNGNFPRSPRPSRNCWPITTPRGGFPNRRSDIGTRRASARLSARPTRSAHLTCGIEVLDGLPQIPQRDQRELEFQAALVTPFWASRGFGSTEAERAAKRAVDLGPQAGTDSPAYFRAIYGLRYSYMLRGNLRAGRPLGEQLLELAGRLRNPQLFAYAHFELGVEQPFAA